MPGDLILIGDINCSGITGLKLDDRLTGLLDDYNLIQRVQSPTYIAPSAHMKDSLLDVVIYFTSPSPVRSVSVSDVGLADHRLVIAMLSVPIPKPETVTFSARNIKKLNRHLFLSRLSNLMLLLSLILVTMSMIFMNSYVWMSVMF